MRLMREATKSILGKSLSMSIFLENYDLKRKKFYDMILKDM